VADLLERVRALLARAVHPETPTEEARTSAVIACKQIVKGDMLGGGVSTRQQEELFELRSNNLRLQQMSTALQDTLRRVLYERDTAIRERDSARREREEARGQRDRAVEALRKLGRPDAKVETGTLDEATMNEMFKNVVDASAYAPRSPRDRVADAFKHGAKYTVHEDEPPPGGVDCMHCGGRLVRGHHRLIYRCELILQTGFAAPKYSHVKCHSDRYS
jgi:hypothetical protein